MSLYMMLAIALLAGFVGTGFVWFGWSALENVVAMRAAKVSTADNDDSGAEA